MQGEFITNSATGHPIADSRSPAKRAERLGKLHKDLVDRFGPSYPMAIRVAAQLAAARTLAGLDGEVPR